MGRKVNPAVFRVASRLDWSSKWYAKNHKYQTYVVEDLKIRRHLKNHLKVSTISNITIERYPRLLRVTILSSKPGIIIGKRGEEVDSLKEKIKMFTNSRLEIFVEEVKRPGSNASLIASNLAEQISRRIPFRRAIKRLITNALKLGVRGIKVMGSGRMSGVEIARKEWYKEGKIPLHTIDANIDYSTAIAKTTYGVIGLKVWVYRGSWNAKLRDVDVAT